MNEASNRWSKIEPPQLIVAQFGGTSPSLFVQII